MKINKTILITAITVLLLVSVGVAAYLLWFAPDSSEENNPQLTEKQQVLLTTYQFFTQKADGQLAECICLENNNEMYSEQFIDQLSEVKEVVDSSECTLSGEGSQVVHEPTGRKVVRLEMLVESVGGNKAQVSVEYYVANLAAGNTTYELEKADGEWEVVEQENHWIS